MKDVSFIIDLDGTIYRGSKMIRHAKEFLEFLSHDGYDYRLFTNCSRNVPAEVSQKLAAMGLHVQADHIVTSGCITKDYLHNLHKKVSVYVIGSRSFKEFLEDETLRLVSDTDTAADYVVVGFCTDFTYDDLSKALWHILHGAQFLTTNLDETIPEGETVVPHTGAISAFVQYASSQKPFNMGKPSKYAGHYFKNILKTRRVFVIGDRIDTDMLFAKKNHFVACLMLTGITTREDAERYARKYDAAFDDLLEICTFAGLDSFVGK